MLDFKPTIDSRSTQLIEWFQFSFPELWKQMSECSHHYSNTRLNPYHLEGSVAQHTLLTCMQAHNYFPTNNIVRFTTLLHDIGKIYTRESIDTTEKVRFINHGGMSAFMCIDILNKTDLSIDDKIMIHKVIALHDSLFDCLPLTDKNISKLITIFKGERELFQHLIYQVISDHLGRFHKNIDENIDDKSVAIFESIASHIEDHNEVSRPFDQPQLIILVGPPCSGKSTFIETASNFTIISRDNLIEELGLTKGLNYTETYQFLEENKDAKKEIALKLNNNVMVAKKNNKNVIIDMASMAKKIRRKWINEFSKYHKKCILFLTGIEELKKRNENRKNETGKFIPKSVLYSMCKQYTLPLYNEGFDSIEYNWF